MLEEDPLGARNTPQRNDSSRISLRESVHVCSYDGKLIPLNVYQFYFKQYTFEGINRGYLTFSV